MVKRKGIVVYFRSNKVLKKLSNYDINITYINKLGKYLTGYVDDDKYDVIKQDLKKIKQIKYVDQSKVDMDDLSFEV
jgi:uncharacterized protein YlbG (UPF0298 family)